MIDIEIATYWNVETLYYVFNGVAAIMGGAGFSGLLKMVFYFALIFGVFAYMGSKQLELAQWFIQALIFTTLLNMPIARVAITDRTGLEPPRTVDNVPFALAVVGQTSNLAFGWLTRTYETVFGVPEEMGLQQGDLAFGHRILKNVNKVTIRDPQLRADLMQFFKECTLYDIKDGVITPDQIVGQTDTWNTVFNNTSPARFVTYNTLSSPPTTDTCANAAIYLKTKVNDGIDAAQKFYGRTAFSRASTDDVAQGMFINAVGSSYDWILSSSATASDSMKQAMFNNIWRDAGSELPALLNDPARVQELQALSGSAMAAKQADGSNSTLAMLAQETLPHMRNWIEAMIYAIFPIVVVMMVMVSAEGAKKLIGGYMMSLAWVGMWPVMFAIINHLSLMHLKHKMAAMKLASLGGVPFQLTDVFDATLGDEQAAIGYLVVMVPFLSGAIIKMAQGGFMSVADRMVSGFSSAGASVGASMASGNVSMGQAGIDTQSVNTTTMNKFDSNIGLQGGGASIGYGDGATATVAANGSMALAQMQNRLLTQMKLDSGLQSERAQEGHNTDITSRGNQLALRNGDAATYSDGRGHGDTRGNFQQTGAVSGTTESGGKGGGYEQGNNLARRYEDSSRFGASSGAQDSFYAGANLNGGRGGAPIAGGNPAAPGQPSAGRVPPGPNQQDERRMVTAMKDSGASPAQIEKAVRDYRGGATETTYRNVTDDYGNVVQIPTGQQRPAGQGQTPAPQQPKGPVRSGGPQLGLGLGAQTQKIYSAEVGKGKAENDSYDQTEGGKLNTQYNKEGHLTTDQSRGTRSDQGDHHSRDAVRSNVRERSTVDDVSDRNERGVGDTASRRQTESATISRDLMADPNLLEKVAQRNGMTAARFMGQGEGRMLAMVKEYAAEKGMLQQAQTMPTEGLSGRAIPQNKGDLERQSKLDRKELPNDIDQTHRRNVKKTGFRGTAPVQVEPKLPTVAQEARAEVDGKLDPNNKQSIPARAAPLVDNVHAWSGAGQKLGETGAKPMGVVEEIEKRDVVDTAKDVKNAVLNVVDRVTGGDGNAYGPQYTPNQKRETQTHLDIKAPEPNKQEKK